MAEDQAKMQKLQKAVKKLKSELDSQKADFQAQLQDKSALVESLKSKAEAAGGGEEGGGEEAGSALQDLIDEQKEVIEEKKPEVNKKALYTGKKKNKETDEGDTGESGNQGEIDGDPNAKAHAGGGIGTDGIAYQLGGRSPEFKAKPIYKIQEEGKVVVIITVDRLGNVVNAIPGAKGSTTLNKYLLAKAKEAAMKTKFSPKQSAPENQQGKIVYHFSLN